MQVNNIYRAKIKRRRQNLLSYMDSNALVFKTLDGDYEELRTGELFEIDELENIIPLFKIIGFEGRNLSKSSILEIYYNEKNKKLKLSDLYIGDIGVITKKDDNKFRITVKDKNRLLYKINEKYIDLENYNEYENINIKENSEIVAINFSFLDYFQELEKQSSEKKRKVLQLYYSRFRKEVC